MSNLPVRKIKILVKEFENDREVVKEYKINAFKITDNLYIHKTFNPKTKKSSRLIKGVEWVITAQPCGWSIWSHCESKKHAEQLAKALSEKFNFNRSIEELKEDKDFMNNGIRFIREFEFATV